MRFFPESFLIFVLIVLFVCLANGQSRIGVGSIEIDQKDLILPCQPYVGNACGNVPSKTFVINVTVTTARSSTKSELRYEVTHGKIIGSGSAVKWDLANQMPGTYRINVAEYSKGKKIGETREAIVTIENGRCICDCVCPALKIYGPTRDVKVGEILYFGASALGVSDVTYNWTVENGEIVSGQGTLELNVKVKRSNSSQKNNCNS